jgi:hypothetical protein
MLDNDGSHQKYGCNYNEHQLMLYSLMVVLVIVMSAVLTLVMMTHFLNLL